MARVRTWLDAHVPEMMREASLPGFSIAVVKDGRTVHAAGFGARDPQKNLPATPDTLFGIGSVTKSFVAIAVLQLAEQGKLRLDDPVSAPRASRAGPPRPGRSRSATCSPTARASPTSGPRPILISRGLGNDTGIPMSSAADFYRFVNGAKDEVAFAPGEHFFYNNAAWRMLGHIVQERSGIPFHRYVKERVLDPLGMTRSTLDVAAAFRDPDHLVPHKKGKTGPEAAPFPYPNPEDNPGFSFLSAAGGIVSSANEMARYVNAQIEQGSFPGGRLAEPGGLRRACRRCRSRRARATSARRATATASAVIPGLPRPHAGLARRLDQRVDRPHGLRPRPEARCRDDGQRPRHGLRHGSPRPSSPCSWVTTRTRPCRRTGSASAWTAWWGSYATYRKLETVKVFRRNGLLHVGEEEPGTPLIPEDPAYGSLRFYTLSEGLRSPVEFRAREDGGLDLVLDRYVFHKQD